jgi:hypothetical protein
MMMGGVLSVCDMNADNNDAEVIAVSDTTYSVLSNTIGQESSSIKGGRPTGTKREVKHKLTQDLVDAKNYSDETSFLLKQNKGLGRKNDKRGLYQRITERSSERFNGPVGNHDNKNKAWPED